MKPGDIVQVEYSNCSKVGIVVKSARKMFMVGPVLEVLIDGEVLKCTIEKVSLLKREEENEGKRCNTVP